MYAGIGTLLRAARALRRAWPGVLASYLRCPSAAQQGAVGKAARGIRDIDSVIVVKVAVAQAEVSMFSFLMNVMSMPSSP